MSISIQPPLWREEDLGKPLPETRHAVSVAMPLWRHVVAYEEGDAQVIGQFQAGYPRFFIHPVVRQLFQTAKQELGKVGEEAMVFPNVSVASRAADYVRKKSGEKCRLVPLPAGRGMTALLLSPTAQPIAQKYWRYCGEIVSSRQAAWYLEPFARKNSPAAAEEARELVKQRLSQLSGQPVENIFLYPTGMAAVAAVQRVVTRLRPGQPTLQVDFPYVDVLKIQQEFGAACRDLHVLQPDFSQQLQQALSQSDYAAIYCEVPSNPLLQCPDIPWLSQRRSAETLLVIDDTVGSVYNVDAFRYADLVTSSLTKFFSGAGDVMAGVAIVSESQPRASAVRTLLHEASETGLWDDDALVLEANSRNYPERIARINVTSWELCHWLRDQPEVAAVYYPALTCRAAYDAIKRPNGGYSGLFSFVPKNAAVQAPQIYDRLRVSKGPSLGTNFTLACPYTLLAHYDELPWAASCGVDANLIRVSVGLEDPADLIERFQQALR